MAGTKTIDEMLWAKQMREQKNDSGKGEEGTDLEEDQKTTLRQRLVSASLAKQKLAKAKTAVMATARLGTGRLLQWAWISLIPSFGLSLVYINMHVFLRWIFPSAFCKLGEEWTPKIVGQHSTKNIAGTAFGIVELMGLVFLDILAFFIIFAILAIIVWLADNIIFNNLLKAWIWIGNIDWNLLSNL